MRTFAAAPQLAFRRADGTNGSRSAIQSGDVIGRIKAFGYGATDYSSTPNISFNFIAAENWTDTNQGSYVTINGVTPGTTTTTALATLQTSGATFPGIVGTTTNDNAAAGNVGEYITSVILIANKVTCNMSRN